MDLTIVQHNERAMLVMQLVNQSVHHGCHLNFCRKDTKNVCNFKEGCPIIFRNRANKQKMVSKEILLILEE